DVFTQPVVAFTPRRSSGCPEQLEGQGRRAPWQAARPPSVPIQPADFLTVALLVALEGLLSADNAMVLAVLVLGLPKDQQRNALRYGIVGAFGFRTAATLLAVYLIRLDWVKLLGAGYLLYLVYRHFGGGESAADRRTPRKAQPWIGLTAFWATVVKVELIDIVFAIDSILVAVAMSPK